MTDVRVSPGSITDASARRAGGDRADHGRRPAGRCGHPDARSARARRVTTTHPRAISGATLRKSLAAIVGTGDGRNVIVIPQSGVIVVRALPAELRGVDPYLRAMQLSSSAR